MPNGRMTETQDMIATKIDLEEQKLILEASKMKVKKQKKLSLDKALSIIL
jgi:hypothetical protein